MPRRAAAKARGASRGDKHDHRGHGDRHHSTSMDFPKEIVAKSCGEHPCQMLSIEETAAPRLTARLPGNGRPAYSAGVADTASAGIVRGSASRRKRRQAMRMSRNSLTQGLGARK
jgi:hypothetical protein